MASSHTYLRQDPRVECVRWLRRGPLLLQLTTESHLHDAPPPFSSSSSSVIITAAEYSTRGGGDSGWSDARVSELLTS